MVSKRNVMLCLLALFGALQFLNFTAFCYPKGRYLSDKEFLDIAVKLNLRSHGEGTLKTKIYSDLDSFYRENENCCRLARWGSSFTDPIIVRVFGFYTAVASIFYRTSDAGGVDNFYTSIVVLNACGGVGEVFGTPVPYGPDIYIKRKSVTTHTDGILNFDVRHTSKQWAAVS